MPSVTLTHPTAGPGSTPVELTLPSDLSWEDRDAWRPVEQVREYATGGALVIDEWVRLAGRPITLAGSDTHAWVTRSMLDTLQAWAQQPALTLTLDLDGQTMPVTFDHAAGALDARPVLPFADPDAADPYIVTLRLIQL